MFLPLGLRHAIWCPQRCGPPALFGSGQVHASISLHPSSTWCCYLIPLLDQVLLSLALLLLFPILVEWLQPFLDLLLLALLLLLCILVEW